MNLEQKEKQLKAALEEARELEKRPDLDDEERADLIKRTELIVKMKQEVKEDKQVRAALAEENGMTEEELQTTARKIKNIGSEYVKSGAYEEAKASSFRGNSAPFVMADAMKSEPTVIDIMGSGAALEGLLTPQRINQILGIASYPTTLVSVIPSVDVGVASSVTYFLEDSETDAIAAVDEGAEKPNFTLAGSEQEDSVTTVAGFAALTRQTLANAAFMAGFVNTRMQLKLEKKKEDYILNGTGTGEPKGFYFRDGGINSASLTETVDQTDAQNIIDSCYLATVQGWEEGGSPSDRFVFKPSDWSTIVLAKDANMRYYGDGPFATAIGDSLWGLPVTKSMFQDVGHVLTGPFSTGALVLTRGGQQVRTSDSHSDYFKKNKVAVLLEEEMGLVVFVPQAFVDLTITSS